MNATNENGDDSVAKIKNHLQVATESLQRTRELMAERDDRGKGGRRCTAEERDMIRWARANALVSLAESVEIVATELRKARDDERRTRLLGQHQGLGPLGPKE